MQGQEAVEYLRRNNPGIGYRQLQSDSRCLQAGYDEKNKAPADIHEAELFMIDRDYPLVQTAENGYRSSGRKFRILRADSYTIVEGAGHLVPTSALSSTPLHHRDHFH